MYAVLEKFASLSNKGLIEGPSSDQTVHYCRDGWVKGGPSYPHQPAIWLQKIVK